MYELAILIILIKHSLFCRMSLRWLHDNLSRSGEEELLQLEITILNSSLEKGFHSEGDIESILSEILILTLQCKAVLKERCKARHKSSMFKHSWLLYLIASIVRSFHLLIQFISSQGPHLLLAISCILLSKKVCLVILTVFRKDFQSLRFLDDLYFIRLLLQSSFHWLFEYFVTLIDLEFLSYACLTELAKELTVFSSWLESDRLEVSSSLRELVTSLINAASLLFLMIDHLKEFTNSSTMGILMVREVWSDVRHHSRWIMWLLSSDDPLHKNMRSMTKFVSLRLSKYLVGTWLMGIDKSRLNESAIMRSSLINKWWENKGF